MKSLKKIITSSQFLFLLSISFFLTNTLIASHTTATNQFEWVKEKQEYFEFDFLDTNITVQIKRNVITIYAKNRLDMRKIVFSAGIKYKCQCCYSFIHNNEKLHKGLHPKEGQKNIPHIHIMHRNIKSICIGNLKVALNLLELNKIINDSQKERCLKLYKKFIH